MIEEAAGVTERAAAKGAETAVQTAERAGENTVAKVEQAAERSLHSRGAASERPSPRAALSDYEEPRSAEPQKPEEPREGSFQYRTFEKGDRTVKEASGRLAAPGAVEAHRNPKAQIEVSRGTGDDAGHLIAAKYGGSGDKENLSKQNWIQNEGAGTWYDLEKRWDSHLAAGDKVDVKVEDISRKGEDRPFMRRAHWTVTSPEGTVTEQTLVFANNDSEKRRNAQRKAQQ